MRLRELTLIAPGVLAVLAGCGSGAGPGGSSAGQSSVASPPPGTSSSSSATGQPTGPAGPTGPTATGGPRPHSPAGPAFLGAGGGASDLNAAESVLQERGFPVVDPGDYRASQTLRVLIGARPGSNGTRSEQAFFFVGRRFTGTDTGQPSARIRVVNQSDTTVGLAYSLYRPADAPCCASGGETTVTYQLDNGRLRPLTPVPSAAAGAASSRR